MTDCCWHSVCYIRSLALSLGLSPPFLLSNPEYNLYFLYSLVCITAITNLQHTVLTHLHLTNVSNVFMNETYFIHQIWHFQKGV